MGVAGDVRKLKSNILRLPYDDRESARVLVQKFESRRYLSQMDQLRVDKLIESATKKKEL